MEPSPLVIAKVSEPVCEGLLPILKVKVLFGNADVVTGVNVVTDVAPCVTLVASWLDGVERIAGSPSPLTATCRRVV